MTGVIRPVWWNGRMAIAAVMAWAMLAPIAVAQETVPELELEEYRIVGRDTRVFEPVGDRISTVTLVAFPIVQQVPERSGESSSVTVGDENRLIHSPMFGANRRVTATAFATGGSHNLVTTGLTLGADGGAMSGMVAFSQRSGKEHTPTNLAPLSRTARAALHLQAGVVPVTIEGGIRHDDDTPDTGLRPATREADRYHLTFRAGESARGGWNIGGQVRVEGGTYRNVRLTEIEESNLRGLFFAKGRALGSAVTVTADGARLSFDDDDGSSLRAGTEGSWLIGDKLGLMAGVNIYTFARPGDDTKFRLYPAVSADLALGRHWYFRARYEPGVTAYSFGDLFDRNGLVNEVVSFGGQMVPMIFEDRSDDLTLEVGRQVTEGLSVGAGMTRTSAENAPVFFRSLMPFTFSITVFDVVYGADVDRQEFFSTGNWTGGSLKIGGEIRSIDTSWNFGGTVPFAPKVRAELDASWRLNSLWTARGSTQWYGSHAVAIGSTATEDGFLLLNTGIDRNLYHDRIVASLDIRNLTNSDGAWWTSATPVPGIGIYVGLTARY